jgi:hypothetical protein
MLSHLLHLSKKAFRAAEEVIRMLTVHHLYTSVKNVMKGI